MNFEEIIFQIILHAGNAKTYSYQALKCAKNKEFEKAEELMKDITSEIISAHDIQNTLIQKETSGDRQEVTLLLMHAEDHLMNAITTKEFVCEIIALYKILYK